MSLSTLTALILQINAVVAFSFRPICNGLRGEGLNGNWEHDLLQVASQNSLRSLMNCVSMTSDHRDVKLCENADAYGNWYRQQDVDKLYCVAPRVVISYNARNTPVIGEKCAVVGGLDACPLDSPSYFDCLCLNNVGQDHIACLSQYFLQDRPYDDYSCHSAGKRDVDPFQGMAEPTAGEPLSTWLQVSYTCCSLML